MQNLLERLKRWNFLIQANQILALFRARILYWLKESIDVSKHLEYLESIKENDLEEHDLELLNIRINNLKGKVSIIKVGGNSELEMKERKDRIDDAVLAVGCALEEGIVEGGGVALIKSF